MLVWTVYIISALYRKLTATKELIVMSNTRIHTHMIKSAIHTQTHTFALTSMIESVSWAHTCKWACVCVCEYTVILLVNFRFNYSLSFVILFTLFVYTLKSTEIHQNPIHSVFKTIILDSNLLYGIQFKKIK